MMKRIFMILAAAAAAAGFMTAGASAADGGAATGTVEAVKRARVITVRQALTDPDSFKDERVLLNGIFMGDNGSCGTKKPVDTSDVMVQDKTGLCIYASGPIPDSYDAATGAGRGTEITLSGFVNKPEKGRPYFVVPPPTGEQKPKKKGASAAQKFALLAGRNKKENLSVEQALAEPDKYINKTISITGVYSGDGKSVCEGAKPVAAAGVSAWGLKGSGKNHCLWVTGALPSGGSVAKGAGGVVYASVAGTLKRQDSGLLVFERAAEKAGDKK